MSGDKNETDRLVYDMTKDYILWKGPVAVPDFQPHGMKFRALPLSQLGGGFMGATFDLWKSWCGDRPAPAWRDVELYALPPSVLPYVTVVDVLDGGRDFKYRFWGTGLTDLFGRDETGRLLSQHVVSQSGEIRFSQFRTVVSEFRPVLFVTAFEQVEGLVAEKVNLRLPIADQPERVTKILTCSEIRRIAMKDHDDLSSHWFGKFEDQP